MYYPMLKHGIDQLCTRRTPLSVLGKIGGFVLGTSTLFGGEAIEQICKPVRYS